MASLQKHVSSAKVDDGMKASGTKKTRKAATKKAPVKKAAPKKAAPPALVWYAAEYMVIKESKKSMQCLLKSETPILGGMNREMLFPVKEIAGHLNIGETIELRIGVRPRES